MDGFEIVHSGDDSDYLLQETQRLKARLASGWCPRVVLEKWLRAHAARSHYLRVRAASLTIGRVYRGWKARSSFVTLKNAASVLVRFFHACKANRFERMLRLQRENNRLHWQVKCLFSQGFHASGMRRSTN